MKGIFFSLLQGYVEKHYDPILWKENLKKNGLSEVKLYFNNMEYPEPEFFNMVTYISKEVGHSKESFLEELGLYMGSHILGQYKAAFNPEWKSFEVIEHIEEFNEHIMQNEADPQHVGKLSCEKIDENHLVVTYESPRQLCFLVKGILKSIALHYKELITIQHHECVLRGGPNCKFNITLQPDITRKK